MSERLNGLLHPVGRPRGGISPDYRKLTKDMPIRDLESPQEVVLAMAQSIGAPCIPTVKKGDVVSIGDVVGDSDQALSVPVHASISGTVKEIREITLAAGRKCQAVVIASDGEDRISDQCQPPTIHTKEDLIQAVRNAGLVGLGGAGFPTHFKLNIPEGKTVDTLLINAAECEPYVTVDHRLMLELTDDIFPALEMITKILKIQNVIIGIEDNKPDAIEAVREKSKNFSAEAKLQVMTLPTHYPQGAEKVLIQSATGRLVPPGKLPVDVGCIVMNIATVIKFTQFLASGKPLTHRTICVTGSAVKNPQNVRVAIGIQIAELMELLGGFKEAPNRVLMGGPMMGIALDTLEIPIIKQNDAILAMTDDDIGQKRTRPCIRCSRCHDACPMNLMPMVYAMAAKHGDVETMKDYSIDVCMECGCCSYVCPSAIPLVQEIRNGKALIRKGAVKK